MNQQATQYPWIELAAKLRSGKMVRNQFIPADDRNALDAWREQHGNRNVFSSIARFSRPDRLSNYICDFFMDIDAPDLEIARHEALVVCDGLRDRMGIDPDSVDIAFSGAKGFHVVVPRIVLGDPTGHAVLTVWRHAARRLLEHGVKHLDLSVYQASRLWRLPNSINNRTGLYKIPLEYRELTDMDLAYVLELARSPREFDISAAPAESPMAVHWMHEALCWARRESQRVAPRRTVTSRNWFMPPCIRAIEDLTLPDGSRHEAYFQYARYMATIGAAPEEILIRLEKINGRNPIQDPEYLFNLSRRAAKYAGFRNCPRVELARFCNPDTCPHARQADGKGSAPHPG